MSAQTSRNKGQLRAWQQAALDKFLATKPKDFMAVATPGAGKTTFALRVATELVDSRTVERVIVVVPTEHLKVQWSAAAARVGLSLDPHFTNSSAVNPSFDGIVVTYAQVGMHPFKHRAVASARRTLVILDEIHHAGDAKSWGDGVREAYDDVVHRLSLTGTPFRSDDSQIPFVRYEEDGEGHLVSRSDHTYDYGHALADGVVRPVVFLAYSGEARWRTSAGEEFAARLGDPLNPEQTARAWKTALDPRGDWIPSVLQAAHTRLMQMRRNMPDAGGLVIATDTTTARAYAKILKELSSTPVSVILSDEPGSSDRIQEFSDSRDEWMVAVRMVSEGVDVPRLAVGVYATSASTPLFSRRRLAVSYVLVCLVRPHLSSCRPCRAFWAWRRTWRNPATTCLASRIAQTTAGMMIYSRKRTRNRPSPTWNRPMSRSVQTLSSRHLSTTVPSSTPRHWILMKTLISWASQDCLMRTKLRTCCVRSRKKKWISAPLKNAKNAPPKQPRNTAARFTDCRPRLLTGVALQAVTAQAPMAMPQ